MAICRSCGQTIQWTQNSQGKWRPVDEGLVYYDEAEAGDILISDDGTEHFVDKTKSLPQVEGRLLHTITCLGK